MAEFYQKYHSMFAGSINEKINRGGTQNLEPSYVFDLNRAPVRNITSIQPSQYHTEISPKIGAKKFTPVNNERIHGRQSTSPVASRRRVKYQNSNQSQIKDMMYFQKADHVHQGRHRQHQRQERNEGLYRVQVGRSVDLNRNLRPSRVFEPETQVVDNLSQERPYQPARANYQPQLPKTIQEPDQPQLYKPFDFKQARDKFEAPVKSEFLDAEVASLQVAPEPKFRVPEKRLESQRISPLQRYQAENDKMMKPNHVAPSLLVAKIGRRSPQRYGGGVSFMEFVSGESAPDNTKLKSRRHVGTKPTTLKADLIHNKPNISPKRYNRDFLPNKNPYPHAMVENTQLSNEPTNAEKRIYQPAAQDERGPLQQSENGRSDEKIQEVVEKRDQSKEELSVRRMKLQALISAPELY